MAPASPTIGRACRTAAALAAVAGLITSAGCGSDDDDDASPTTTSEATTTEATTTVSTSTTTTSTTTTIAPTTAPATTASPEPPEPPPTIDPNGPSTTIEIEDGAPTANGAVEGLLNAWKQGDRDNAAAFAEPDAITTLFAEPYPPGGTTQLTCQADGDFSACPVRGGGERVFRVLGGSGGFRVVAIAALDD